MWWESVSNELEKREKFHDMLSSDYCSQIVRLEQEQEALHLAACGMSISAASCGEMNASALVLSDLCGSTQLESSDNISARREEEQQPNFNSGHVGHTTQKTAFLERIEMSLQEADRVVDSLQFSLCTTDGQ